MTFGEKTKIAREKMFLSQHAFAEELGVAFATVNRWETGRCKPNYKAKKLFYDFCVKNAITFDEE